MMAMTENQHAAVAAGRRALKESVTESTDPSSAIHDLLDIDIPLTEKFVILNFCDLMARNAESPDNLKRLIMGLNILEKYGRHLLKPRDSRSNMWRHIKYSNSIFRDRVDTIQGGRDIMFQMGYTVSKSDGVAFPDGVEPDHEKTMNLVVDILLGKKELEMYLAGSHPHPQYIETYIAPDLVDVLKASSSLNSNMNRAPVHTQATSNGASIQGSVPSQIPGIRQMEDKKQAPPMKLDVSLATTVATPLDRDTKTPSIACDICGENHADYVCAMCDNKQLCKDCHIKWHKHPKRQNHKLQPIRPPLDTLPGSVPSVDMNQQQQQQQEGNRQSTVSHHSQQSQHQTQFLPQHEAIVQGAGGLQAREAISMYPTVPRGGNPNLDNVGYSLPPNMINQSNHRDTSASTKQFSESNPRGDAPICYTPHVQNSLQNNMAYSHQWSGHPVMTSQQSMMSHMHGGMSHVPAHYTSSVGMQMSPNQDIRYGMAPVGHVAQYPASYMNLYQQPDTSGGYSYITPHLMATPRHGELVGAHLVQPATNKIGQRVGSPISQNYPNTMPCRPESAKTPSTPGSSGSVPSISHFLPSIIAIPDLEKRRARIEVNLMTLQEDIRDWDTRINCIILNNPNFFQDEELNELNRKKRKHLQEINELEKYNKELNKMIADKTEKEAEEIKEKANIEKELEFLKRRFNQVTSHEQAPPGSPGLAYQPGYPNPPQYVRQTGQPGINLYSGMIPAGPENPVYMPANRMVNQSTISSSQKSEDKNQDNAPPSLTIASLKEEDDEDCIRRMLVLDVNPFKQSQNVSGNPSSTMNIPVNPPNIETPKEVSYPPALLKQPLINSASAGLPQKLAELNISDFEDGDKKATVLLQNSSSTPMKHGLSEPSLSKDKTAVVSPIRKNQSLANFTKWECEHCTYINDSSKKACGMCYKTSDNPKLIGQKILSVQEEHSGADNQGEQCEFCTFKNMPGTQICELCAKTQTKYASREPQKKQVKTDSKGPVQQEGADLVAAQVKQELNKSKTVGKMIDEEQDQVYLEKKAAHKRYEQMRKGEIPDSSGDIVVVEVTTEGPTGGATGVAVTEGAGAAMTPELSDANTLHPNRDVEHVRKRSGQEPSSGSTSGSYNSASSSLDPNLDVAMGTIQVKDSAGKVRSNLNFVEAIEQINMRRAQEQMSLDGHELMSIVKEAEKLGFEIPETEIALQRSSEDAMKPIEWLKIKWQGMIDLIVSMAADEGKKGEQNDVGDMSSEEAKKALLKSDGDVNKAVDACVRDRKNKYQEINACGRFAREDILTALYQNYGDKSDALDQLNQRLVQGYYERLWTGATGGAVAAMASRLDNLNTSGSVNSVISEDDFQLCIRDTTTDLERRIRMMFVEGKLRSWGRAETVITILDKYVTNSPEPLECSLEDIIEAVRNCGDRQSSLVYLTQECGICYSLYPMSKIRNLGSCNCKLCNGCLKQNFEVVIRERYVRNWSCPLCESPQLEDEDMASQYFELLSMMLQQLVSQEVMDLFDTKLRDWHLQKDPNFRWCAHCASGFIWDRPQVLGMTCPSCTQKTCFMCKKTWEDQHEGLTCEQFTQWKIDNDPQRQSKGVQVYLEENGIDCPSCKMRYSLAKGGCMHFKCPQCGHEFCSGCSQAFLQQGICKLLKSCKNRGLHCHHPRDCFYYLRDESPADLQRLLKTQRVEFNTEVPTTQEDRNHCPVMEQKEHGIQKKDEECGKDTVKGMAGLCELHYKEYLVGLINKNKIDPVANMSVQQMNILIHRHEKEPPKIGQNESEAQYRKRLTQFIKERFKIQR